MLEPGVIVVPCGRRRQETQEGALVFQGTAQRDALCRAGKEQCCTGEDVSLHYTPCSGRAIFKPKAEAAAGVAAGPGWFSPFLQDAPSPPMSCAPLSHFWDCGSRSWCLGWRTSEGCEWSPSPRVLLGFPARRFSPESSPRPRSQQGWELLVGKCWKYSVSCATNDFLRQTIGAAGSYRSLPPIPASAGCSTGPRCTTALGWRCPWPRCSDGTSAASELLIPKSWSGRVLSPDFRCLPNIFGCAVQM